jgi:hypothetical protein
MFELMFVRERVRKGYGSAENDALTVIVLCNRADLEAKDIVFENSGRYLPGNSEVIADSKAGRRLRPRGTNVRGKPELPTLMGTSRPLPC